MKVIPFSIYEFLITEPKTVELEVCDKIWKYHIIPMVPVREALGVAIWPSLKSGYRPEWYEKSKNRNGNSEHCFKGKGAVDWTCMGFVFRKDKLLQLIIEHTEYTRIAVYDGFIHCDHKPTASGKREIYTSNAQSKWEFWKYAA